MPGSSDQRASNRLRVLLIATIESGADTHMVKLRDMSCTGALIETPLALTSGSVVKFIRGDTNVSAQVIWARGGKVGLKFTDPISEAELLSHIGRQREARTDRRTIRRQPD